MANYLIRNLIFQIQKRLLNTSATITPISPLPTAPSASSSSYTVQFLVKSCGLSLESAISCSKKFQLDEKKKLKHQSVVEFLKSHDFKDAQIAKLIIKWPAILSCKTKNNLQPKFEYLKENGFVGELLPKLIVSNPVILNRGLDSHIKQSFDFLRSVISSKEKILAAINRYPLLLSSDLKGKMQPHIDLLMEEGVPPHNIETIISLQPVSIMQSHDRMVYAVNSVKNFGLEPTSYLFPYAVRVMLCMTEETWKKKIELMKSMGWSEEEVLLAFKKEPSFLGFSEDKLKNAMYFYLNTVKLELQTIIAYPKFLSFSLDKRLRPRYNVLKVLESKKLIEEHKKLEWLLTIAEKNFQKDYVLKYADVVPGLLDIYPLTKDTEKEIAS